MRKNQSKYTPEIVEYVKSIIKGKSRKQIREMTNAHFGREIFISEMAVKGFCKRFNLVSGLDGRFKRGHSSYLKSKKLSPEMYEKLQKTMYKKGNKPLNKKEIGEERIAQGRVFIKVSDKYRDGENYKNWRLKNIIVYEQHFGPVPKGHRVIFLDGNPLNNNIDNLACVPDSVVMVMNRCKLKYQDPELTKTGINIAKLKLAVTALEKKKKEAKKHNEN